MGTQELEERPEQCFLSVTLQTLPTCQCLVIFHLSLALEENGQAVLQFQAPFNFVCPDSKHSSSVFYVAASFRACSAILHLLSTH